MQNFTTFLRCCDSFSINNFAFFINNESFSQGGIALKFPNPQIKNLLITLVKRLLDAFWCHFWTWSIFHVFESEIIVFWYLFFGKNHKVSEGAETPFFVKSSPSIFPRGKSLLNLRFFANFVKKLNCSYLLIEGS